MKGACRGCIGGVGDLTEENVLSVLDVNMIIVVHMNLAGNLVKVF